MTKPTKSKITREQLSELEAKWKRALADYQNLEKRTAAEKNQFIKFANITLIIKLLTILDNLERAYTHVKDQGLEMVLNQFRQVLKEEGVEEIQAAGKDFDPQHMECVDKKVGQNNKVVEMIQKGYTVHGQVVRPAKVVVGSQSEEKNRQGTQETQIRKEMKESNSNKE